MRIEILTIGHKMPKWVQMAIDDYIKRIDPSFQIKMIEFPPEKISKNKELIKKREGEVLLSEIKPNAHVIALDVQGEMLSTLQMSQKLQTFQMQTKMLYFLIGGSEGLSEQCLERANEKWSLSKLTFPHLLARVILIEQIYRGISFLQKHPYHRE